MFELYLIADRDAFGGDADWLAALARVASLVASSPKIGLQIRIRGRGRVEQASLADAALAKLGPARERAFLNGGGIDATGYAGVHWPEDALPHERSPGRNGASVHSLDALHRAEAAGAAFAVFSPVFDPSTKPVRGVGVDALRVVAAAAQVPVFALGGITPDRVLPCLAAGAAGVAVMSGLFLAKDPSLAARRYLAALDARRPASFAE